MTFIIFTMANFFYKLKKSCVYNKTIPIPKSDIKIILGIHDVKNISNAIDIKKYVVVRFLI